MNDDQPNDTQELLVEMSPEMILRQGVDPSLLTLTAQQAVLPRSLDEGVYGVLDADGAIQVVETPGYRQQRKHDWEWAHSDRPEFIRRNVTLLDVDSFVDYLARNTGTLMGELHNTPNDLYAHAAGLLELWADIDNRRILAILDGIYGLRQHTATLNLVESREWNEWAEIDGELLSQVEFALFIEDHLSTIARPDGAKLLDICQTLEATKGASFRQQTILSSGQRQFLWEETVDAKAGQKGELTIPGDLTLALRPFQGNVPVPILARFRYRAEPGGLRLGIKMAEPGKALEDAFNLIVADVQTHMPVRVNFGRP